MTKRPYSNPPSDVLQALESLENAHSAADLGPSYQALLDWRRKHARNVFTTNALAPILVLVALRIGHLFISNVDIPVTDFWRGVQVGLTVAAVIFTIQNLIWPRPEAPETIARRIEAAIDRWRHTVPAMRELPK